MTNDFNLKEIDLKFKMGISSGVFSAYFQDKEDFKNFLNKLSKKEQEKFFRLSKFYNDFIRNPLFEDENVKKYFSLIMIFSLIEVTISKERHLTFDQYLLRNFVPISTVEILKQKQKEYFIEFGSQKKVKKFFDDYVDEECKKIFTHAICINSENKQNELSVDENIKQNIELFYKWRSNFVHHAEMPVAFQKSGFYMRDKDIITTAYTKEDFEKLFEHGFLRYFGYTKDFEHKNTEEKIERYKNHTIHKVSIKITQSIKSLNKFLKLKI